jgi:hypothetical protein
MDTGPRKAHTRPRVTLRIHTRTALLSTGLLVGLTAVGCGGGGGHVATPGGTASTAGAPPATAVVPSNAGSAAGRTRGSGALTMAGLGTLAFTCRGTPTQLTGTLAGRIAASETVHVQDAGLAHVRSGHLQPPAALSVRVRGAVMLWHVVQETEGSTTDVMLRLTFAPGCAEMRWSSLVLTIDHTGSWQPPSPWL